MRLRASMKPSVCCQSIYEIDLAGLYSVGYRGLIFDIDNTLEPYATEVPGEKLIAWLRKAAEKGFQLAILSNAKKERVERFCAGFPQENFPPILSVYKGGKPLSRGFTEIKKKFGLNPGRIVMVGDQLFTDILGGNQYGAMTVLVKPIAPEIEPPFVRFKRILEKPFRHHFR